MGFPPKSGLLGANGILPITCPAFWDFYYADFAHGTSPAAATMLRG